MRNDGCWKYISLITLTFAIGGCAGGGGNTPTIGLNSAPPQAPAPAPQPAPSAPTTAPYVYDFHEDTGTTGPLAAPAAAVWGTATPQSAVPGAGTDTPQPAIGLVFPALTTGLQFSPGGAVALSIGRNSTATVIDSLEYEGPYTTLQLAIPDANVNTKIYAYFGGPEIFGGVVPAGVNYVALGMWGSYPVHPVAAMSSGVQDTALAQSGPMGLFLVGYETPAGAMPTSGQASYTGFASGWVFAPIDGHVMTASLSGSANLLADFASGKASGALTGITYQGGEANSIVATGPWNDVSLNAVIASGSNRFSGSTAVTSTPANPYSLGAAATGHIDGAFFGPSAQAIGALWTLSDGNAIAVGGVTGH